MRSDDLLAAVFPGQVGCQDNHGGADIEPPDHPLVNETLKDCLHDAMDLEGLKRILAKLKSGEIRTIAVDTPEPSVFSHQILTSQPYTYLDEAPLEERRARAVNLRRTLPASDAAAFGALDDKAIAQVIDEAWPPLRSPDELHDALLQWGIFPRSLLNAETSLHWVELVSKLRGAELHIGPHAFCVARERMTQAGVVFPLGDFRPPLPVLPGDVTPEPEAALLGIVRGWMEVLGPITAPELGHKLSLQVSDVEQAFLQLESSGQVIRGKFRTLQTEAMEWCDRRLLQRIHRLTVGRLRKEIEPLSGPDFMRFLFRWHHLEPGDALQGKQGLLKVVSLLQGFEAPSAAWESRLLAARMIYQPELLERACWEGEVSWFRLSEASAAMGVSGSALLTFSLRDDADWMRACRSAAKPASALSPSGRQIVESLEKNGACFFRDLARRTGQSPSDVEQGLVELLAQGWVTADAVENLRILQSPKRRKRLQALQRGGPGRWALVSSPTETVLEGRDVLVPRLARLFLTRYGIVFRDLLGREPLCPPWRDLLSVYRRMEARGEIRGGRFVAGFVGEQFALPDAVDSARAVRRAGSTGQTVTISAVDPLNLTGLVMPGLRIPARLGKEVVYVDGVASNTSGSGSSVPSGILWASTSLEVSSNLL